MTSAFFNNLCLKHGGLFQFENNQFYLVAVRPYSWKKTKRFGSHDQSSFIYTLRLSVSLLTSASNFQTIVAGIRHMAISRYFCFLCNVLWTICWHYKILIFDVSLDINCQLRQKVKKSCTR